MNKDKNKLKLAGVGAAVITIKADETKHYKAAVKKVNVIQPVSYTHLEVYKRQATNILRR